MACAPIFFVVICAPILLIYLNSLHVSSADACLAILCPPCIRVPADSILNLTTRQQYCMSSVIARLVPVCDQQFSSLVSAFIYLLGSFCPYPLPFDTHMFALIHSHSNSHTCFLTITITAPQFERMLFIFTETAASSDSSYCDSIHSLSILTSPSQYSPLCTVMLTSMLWKERCCKHLGCLQREDTSRMRNWWGLDHVSILTG